MSNSTTTLSIACVIVTFNRKQLLQKCLDAVAAQSYKPCVVYIVDNASTDGTMGSVGEWGYKNTFVNGIRFEYLLLPSNQGGAGGFYAGMKCAHETGSFDAIWVMDDDGEPAGDCLERMIPHLDKYDYLSPLVVDCEDHTQTSFMQCSVEAFKAKGENGIVKNAANPFNGILYSIRLIDSVGYPKKEMFIWGDETNYEMRCVHQGYNPVVVLDAVHYHPKDRQQLITLKKWGEIRITDSPWKYYCLVRNVTYNYLLFIERPQTRFKVARNLLRMYSDYSLHNKKSFRFWVISVQAVLDGYFQNFSHLKRYMK